MESLIVIIFVIIFVAWLARLATRNKRDETPIRLTETTIKTESLRSVAQPPAQRTGQTNELVSMKPPEVRSSPPTNLPSPPSSHSSYSWIRQGEQVKIAGYSILGGLIYVGTGLRAVSNGSAEPALVNPTLPVILSPDIHSSVLGYWPSYDRISPQGRAKYLEWLAGGRLDPSIDITYVFLFFYGLERRVLLDAQKSEDARADVEPIISEVERLLLIHGENGSFQGYASNFLEITKLLFSPDNIKLVPPTGPKTWELPLVLKLALGKFAAEGRPVQSEWALSWLEYHPQVWLRTPARRCRTEFVELFTGRYREQFGEGIILKSSGPTIRIDYRPASGSFVGTNIHLEIENRPDVSTQTESIDALRKIADGCINDLDAYSRFVGRNVDVATSLGAMALLPLELLKDQKSQQLTQMMRWIDQSLGLSDVCVCEAQILIEFFGPMPERTLPKQQAVLISQLLDKLGYGVEPDIRFGDEKIDPKGKVVLFRVGKGSPSVSSPAYKAATLILRLAVAVTASDGVVSEQERLHLEKHIESVLMLTSAERQRLRAYLQKLLVSSPDFTGMKKRLSQLDQNRRRSIGDFLVNVADVDGKIEAGEVGILRKIYTLLQLDPDKLYSDIHAAQTQRTEKLVTILPGDLETAGYKIPSPNDVISSQASFQMGLVEKTLRETEAVQSILADIFISDDDAIGAVKTPILSQRDQTSLSLLGLDPMHSMLIKNLSAQQSWQRTNFEELCAKYGLLPDGAIENINMAAYEIYNDAFMEDGEVIEINPQIAKEIIV